MANRIGRIFISYRRADSAAVVDHLYDRLVARYGRKCIFRDIDNIPFGTDFRRHIRSVIDECDIVLAIIGKHWSGGRGSSGNRIMRNDDPVRIEIEVAIETGALVIPVLIGGAEMPSTSGLPESLAGLRALNAAPLATGRDFEHHLGTLFAKLDEALRQRGKAVVRRPDWLVPGISVAATLAVAPPILFAASALFGIPFSGGVVTVGVFTMTLAAALASSLFAVDAILAGRIGWSHPQQRPLLAGSLLFLIVTPVYYWAGDKLAAAIPVQDPDHLSKQLLAEFQEAQMRRLAGQPANFDEARRIVMALRKIDPENGTAWYFAGEIARRGEAQLFPGSCFKGWPAGKAQPLGPYEDDFLRYRDNSGSLGGANMNDWGTTTCYEGNGYCAQRTAWVNHLLAYDTFVLANQSTGEERIRLMTQAKRYVGEALRFARPEGGNGFTQCLDSNVMLDQINAFLSNERPN